MLWWWECGYYVEVALIFALAWFFAFFFFLKKNCLKKPSTCTWLFSNWLVFLGAPCGVQLSPVLCAGRTGMSTFMNKSLRWGEIQIVPGMGCKLTDTLFCSCSPFWLRLLCRVLCFLLELFPHPLSLPFVICFCCCWKVCQWCESVMFAYLNSSSWTTLILFFPNGITTVIVDPKLQLCCNFKILLLVFCRILSFFVMTIRMTVCAASYPPACVLYFYLHSHLSIFQVRDLAVMIALSSGLMSSSWGFWEITEIQMTHLLQSVMAGFIAIYCLCIQYFVQHVHLVCCLCAGYFFFRSSILFKISQGVQQNVKCMLTCTVLPSL